MSPTSVTFEGLHVDPGFDPLIEAIIGEFAAYFVPSGVLVYANEAERYPCSDTEALTRFGVHLDAHDKLPDVVIHDTTRGWLFLVDAISSHGLMDNRRRNELACLFADSSAGLVYVTAFPSRSSAGRYMTEIAWETEVWVAEAPTHLIHFNGSRFLGPYQHP